MMSNLPLHDAHVRAWIHDAARGFVRKPLVEGFKAQALHAYVDANGAPLYWRIRLKNPDTGGKWIRPMSRVGGKFELKEPKFENGKPLYSLDRIANESDAVVWIVEGEQKADTLAKLGLVATTSGGATSYEGADWSPLRQRVARIWPDNDEAGRAYAGEVANLLIGMGCVVSCIDVDKLGLGVREDVIDWLAAHQNASASDIEGLPILAALPGAVDASGAVLDSRNQKIVVLDIAELLIHEFPPMEPLLSPWLCRQHLSMVYAWRGVGKTHFALGVAYAVAGGGQFLKWKANQPRRVVYIDGEMAGAAIKTRLAALVESSSDEHEPPEGFFRIITPDAQCFPLPDLASRDGQKALEPYIVDADLIVVDNLSSLMRAGAENEGESWVPVAEWALHLRKLGKAVLFVHHAGKGGQQRGSSRREDLMDVVVKLDHAKDYVAEKGAAFTVEFEKARHLKGDEARGIEATLGCDANRNQVWTWKDAELGMTERIQKLHLDAPDLSQTEIANELGCHRSTVSRALKEVPLTNTRPLR